MKQPNHYLVIDDDSTSNLICDFTIQRFDKEALRSLFTSPEEALEFISTKNHPSDSHDNIIFLDVNMPTMTGFEFLEEFGKLDDDIKEQYNIYMLTSSIEDFSSRAKEFPVVKGFLSKPLKLSHLEDVQNSIEKQVSERQEK